MASSGVDESSFIELLVANERIQTWMEALKKHMHNSARSVNSLQLFTKIL